MRKNKEEMPEIDFSKGVRGKYSKEMSSDMALLNMMAKKTVKKKTKKKK
jgi:hypothetical protein